ncbi:ATP-binding cassette sub-family C member 9-like [Asterias amurensis]|uniref:ATP-binding cassette sub-family C member 9-like n=1 Tax=Asterias amurensis TaxID=7602 RepID=UPI003AB6735D
MSNLEWEWFCGKNNTDLRKDQSEWTSNTCFINGLTALPPVTFTVVSSLALLLTLCFSESKPKTKYLLLYPGHTTRWVVSLISLLVLAAAVGEGALTDATYRAWQHPTQPHLYVPGATSLVAMILSLIYYHHMELWQTPSMSIPLVCYWGTAVAGEGLRLINFKQLKLIDANLLRFDSGIIMLVILCSLFLIEANLIRIKVFCKRKVGYKHIHTDLTNPNMHFLSSYVNLPSSVTLWWMNWLFAKGYKKPLEITDLGDIPEYHQAQHNHRKFKKAFEIEQARAKRKGTRPSMWRIYLMVYGFVMLKSAVLKIIHDMLNVIGPLCIGALTAYVVTLAYPDESEQLVEPHFVTFREFFTNGFVLIAVLFLALLVKSSFFTRYFHIVYLESANVRAALQTMVFEKALRLSTFTTTGGQMTMGQITNHMASDATNVMTSVQTVSFLWSSPIKITLILVLTYFQIGLSALIGASCFLIVIPLQAKVGAILASRQKAILLCADQRLKQTNEVLQGIKLLKMYAWEQLYCEAIEAVRKRELRHLLWINTCLIVSVFMTLGLPFLVTFMAFSTYTPLTGKLLTPDITFSTLALFNEIAIPLYNIPLSLSALVSAVVSSRRLMTFLLAPEVQGRHKTSAEHDDDLEPKVKIQGSIGTQTNNEDLDGNELIEMNEISRADYGETVPQWSSHSPAVKISNGNFSWDPDSESALLADINVEIPAGKLTMVIGQVGSGKSSLLSAILGEMATLSGNVEINQEKGQIAFAAQKPWLLNASLQENILFSSNFESKRYNDILEACALQPDISILPAGDETEIGEKGINLSGGQKQRVSVARTMYADRDIIILDDPLSALDVHVGRQLFEEGIIKLLLNRKKTVILVTHQLQYLNRADLILEMKDGRIAAIGDLDDIIKADPEMYEEIKQVAAVGWDDNRAESAEEERHILQQMVSKISLEDDKEKGDLVEKEEIARGAVSIQSYLYLVRSTGWGLSALTILAFVVHSGFAVSTNFWLSGWSEAGLSNESQRSQDAFLVGYASLSLASALSQLLSVAAVMMSFWIAAKRLHAKMLRNIIRVPLRFFDTTLIGRVLNRFSNDVQQVDFRLANSMNGLLITIMQCISSLVVVSIVMYLFVIFIVPIVVVYFILQKYFLASSRELQRLENTSKSPVLAYFSESLGGLSTLRAYGYEQKFFRTILNLIDKNTAAFVYVHSSMRWLGFRLDFLGSLLVFFATLSTLTGAVLFGIDPSLVGLSATYALQVSVYLNYLVVNRSLVEMMMNAVERIQYFTEVNTEDYGGTKPPSSWPQKGDIRIEDISVRYASDLDAVLTGVSIHCKAGEKIGICGRTGSGKSSLALALLRVIDTFEGCVFIDDVDIKSVPLTTLRGQMSIIPQDPVLFTGSIRHNLDPEETLSDDDLWHALEIAQMKLVVSNLDEGLDAKVTEGGENFSVGQRQLFCLARAFIRKSRILIMDEATASVDMETDKLLQTIVATAFIDRTVLTIAHRIATIRSSDKILVLDAGHVAEFGPPDELLANEEGIFSSLVRDH